MMFRAAIALIALAVAAFAQHGGTHAGSFGNRGFPRAAGSSSHPAFSQSPSFARPAPPARYGTSFGPSAGAGYRVIGPRNYSSLRTPYNGTPYNGNRYNSNRFTAGRPTPGRSSYDPRGAGLSRGSNRDRFNARRRQFQNWYVSTYPNWLGYPYLIDPNFYNLGLYDWGDSDNSAYDSSGPGNYQSDQAYDQNGPAPLYPPYPDQGYAAPGEQPAFAAPVAPSAPEQFLTVIFKSGRAPIEVQNYLMTAKVLTDLDSEHYEQIPLDQIDLAATKRFNTFAGVDFQVPGA